MKTTTLLLAMIFPCFAQQEGSVVRFSNGDKLTGDLLALTGEKLSWKSLLLKEPAEFDLKYVDALELSMAAPPADQSIAAHEVIIGMTNGDTIRGQLAGITDTEIRLSTWYAEELMVKRANVKTAKITSLSDIHYRGPNSMDEWSLGEGEDGWRLRGGALRSMYPGGIAREVDFPDECVISFEAAWRGAFNARIVFFSKDSTSPSGPRSGYEMDFQGETVQFKELGSNKKRFEYTRKAGMLRANEKARIEIKASLKSGKFALFVDDQFINSWQDGAVDRKKLGEGFHIIARDTSPLSISNIEVYGWDGYLEKQMKGGQVGGAGDLELDGNSEVPKPVKEELPEGRMLLRNGDTIEGEVLGIVDEEITLKTPIAEVKFPLARLKNMYLSSDTMEDAKLYKADVRATLSDGSCIVFRFDGVEGNSLIGFSQNFGTARFRKDAFRRIEFNLYQ
jgi:hypothetical protein